MCVCIENCQAVMTSLTGDQTSTSVCVAVRVCWYTPLCEHLLVLRLKQWVFELGKTRRESKSFLSIILMCFLQFIVI